jgi:hypothetical protein
MWPFVFNTPDTQKTIPLHVFIVEYKDTRFVVITDDINRAKSVWGHDKTIKITETKPDPDIPLIVIKTDQITTENQLKNEKDRLLKEIEDIDRRIVKEKNGSTET